jgi:hypothetical protein
MAGSDKMPVTKKSLLRKPVLIKDAKQKSLQMLKGFF